MKRLAFVVLSLALVFGGPALAEAMPGHGDHPFMGTGHGNTGYGSGRLADDAPSDRQDAWTGHGDAGVGATADVDGDIGGWLAREPWWNAPDEETVSALRFGADDERSYGARDGTGRGPAGRGHGEVRFARRIVAEDWLIRAFMAGFLADYCRADRYDRHFRGGWYGWDHWGRHHHWDHDCGHHDPVPTPIPGAALLFAPGLAAIAFFTGNRRLRAVGPSARASA